MFSDGVNGDIQYRVDHPKDGQRTMHSTGEPVFREWQSRAADREYTGYHRAGKCDAGTAGGARPCMDQAEALSHTGSFGWNLATGELIWSDETFGSLVTSVRPNQHWILRI